jgi:cellulose-binding protein
MRKVTRVLLLAIAVLAVAASTALADHSDKRKFGDRDREPRTIVTTDPELDDLNSLIRLLLYSNEIRIEGLVYASGQHHYAGDPDAGIPAYRWKAGQSHIEDALDAYDRVDRNLRRHDAGFPTAAQLRSKFRVGNISVLNDISESTPGSRLIADVLLDDKPGPVYLQAWGGVSTIARGLLDIEARYKGTRKWDAIYRKVSKKAIITRWGAQDDTYATYVAPNWPQIENREVATNIWGYFTRNSILPEDRFLVDPEWTAENVSQVGPLGELYRVWGDGRFMAEFGGPEWEGNPRQDRCMPPPECPDGPFFDDEDFFGFDSTLPENSRANLIARGYNVWTTLQPPGAFISEGDSSNFALLIDNGLRSHENATWGGWGGRQVLTSTDPLLYAPPSAEAGDVNPATGTRTNGFHASRWWRDIQMDFAARMLWSVTRDPDNVNHEPIARVPRGLLDINVRPGQRVQVVGFTNDPDGDHVTPTWWHYPEAGTYPGTVDVTTKGSRYITAARFTVPRDAQRGQAIHLILEVEDDGTPPMTSYQRVVATVK